MHDLAKNGKKLMGTKSRFQFEI